MNLYESIKSNLNESDSYELLCDCYSCGQKFYVPLKDTSNVQQLIGNSQEVNRSISVRDAKKLNIVCPNCKSSEVSIIQVDPLNESEEGNNNANNIIVKFEQSDRNSKIYFKALTLISQLENENHITKDEYDMYIDKLNKLYAEGQKN